MHFSHSGCPSSAPEPCVPGPIVSPVKRKRGELGAKQSKGMASNLHHAAEPLDEEDEVVDRPRPRRRFRGLHWRHASQTYTPPPPPTQPQYSAPQLRPLSLSLGQSGFDGLDTIHSPPVAASTSAAAVISPETPPSAGSYSYNPLRGALTARTLSKSFANELSKVFNIDEDPQVEELEKTLREKWDSS